VLHCKNFFMVKVFMATLLAFGMQARAQPIDPSCAEVARALHKLREQAWVLVHGAVTRGVHPELYTSMSSALLDGRRQIRILDGVHFGTNIDANDKEALDRVTGALEFYPDSPCIPHELHKAGQLNLTEYSYSAKVSRAEAYYRLWISTSSGLPVRVQIDGPQLIYRRALSRPGKAPQVTLWPNGLRYDETREFIFGAELVNQSLAGTLAKP
jgi:hypothetical protein